MRETGGSRSQIPSCERLEKNAFALEEEGGDGADVPTLRLALGSVFMDIKLWVGEVGALYVGSAAIAMFLSMS